MPRALTLLLVLWAPALPAQSSDEADRLFTLGTTLFAQGDATGAAAAFEGARATGLTSAALEHNLGTAYLEAGRYPQAVLHLERARLLRPRDPLVRHNLDLARRRALGTDAALPEGFMFGTLSTLERFLGAWGLFGIAVVVALLLGGLAWRLQGPWRRRGLVVGGALLGLTLAAAFAVSARRAVPRGVLLQPADVRAQPGPSAPVRAAAPAGLTVRLGEAEGEWQTVTLPGGAHGWVRAGSVESL